MTATCPAGHTSESEDYCDVCGMPIDSGPAASPLVPPPPADVPVQAALGSACPNCGTDNVPDALFCEACGYDFTTDTMPRSAVTPAPAEGAAASASGSSTEKPPRSADSQPPDTAVPNVSAALDFAWVAEVWIDPAWYEVQESAETMPSPGLPSVVPLRNKSVLVGRTSKSRNITPDIDCEPDTGTSRRQAQLTTDGTRWWVEDLESSNGTFVGPASGPLPEDPIAVGTKRELNPDDRIYVGAWTRLVIRQATEDELTSLT